MTINVPLLRKTMEHIEAHPDQHDQGWWSQRTSCGTTHCFAGWAVLLDDPAAEIDWCRSHRLITGELICDRAQNVLGLCDADARRLFYAPAFVELRRIINELIEQSDPAGAA